MRISHPREDVVTLHGGQLGSQTGSKRDLGERTDSGEGKGSPSKREEESAMGKKMVLRKWAERLFSGAASG